MSARNISFHTEDIDFVLPNKTDTRNWLVGIADGYRLRIRSLVYVFCSDTYLHQLNVQYLDHDTLTDIITFDYNDEAGEGKVAGELYISLDRVRENAKDHGETADRELARVMAHGLLHLCGLKDKTDQDAAKMRSAEDQALLAWNVFGSNT
jgi:rRNA maturation RNase YbeY